MPHTARATSLDRGLRRWPGVLGGMALVLAVAAPAQAPARRDGGPDDEKPAAVAPGARPLGRAVDVLADPTKPLPKPLPADPSDPCPQPPDDERPCFPVSVAVRALTPEQKLARFFEDFDFRYGPTFASAPTLEETWPRAKDSGVPLNFVPLIQLLLQLRKDHRPPVFFLYTVRDGEQVRALLHEGRLPADVRYARPGVIYQELGGFPDRKSAQAAYQRLRAALAVHAPGP